MDNQNIDAALELLKAQGYEINKPAKKDKIRLIYYGDAPSVATGFGQVSKNLLTYLHNTGDYEIYCFGVNYMGVPHPFPFQIYPMLPNPQGDPYGREKVSQIIPQMEFDVAFFLQDSFILTFLPNIVNECKKRGKNFKTLAYFPIDGTPWREWVEAMSFADIPVTYTEWGKKECLSQYPEIGDRLKVIPHGVNTREFFPVSKQEKENLRKMFFGPHADKFIIINVNRNQQRKDIPRTLMAFKEFKKECPKSILYLHMAEKDVGWDLPRVCQHLGLNVGEEVIFPRNFNVNSGFPVEIVNQLYNCADVCVSTSVGEGWGLAVSESFQTLTPVIAPDCCSFSEICADGRAFLARSGDTPNMRMFYPMDNEVQRNLCDINQVVRYLKRLYENPSVGVAMAEKAHKWVNQNLIWEKHITPRFDSLIKQLYTDLKNKPTEVVSENTEQPNDWKKGEVI